MASPSSILRWPDIYRQLARKRPRASALFLQTRMKGRKLMSRSVFVRSLAVAAVLFVAWIGVTKMVNARPSPAQASTAEVKIDNFSFGPQSVTVAVGTTVTWVNHDDIPHTVVSNDGVFKSKVLDTEDKFSFTFSKAGSFPYFCSIHPKMTGKVVVQ
jgi:plastocyanin